MHVSRLGDTWRIDFKMANNKRLFFWSQSGNINCRLVKNSEKREGPFADYLIENTGVCVWNGDTAFFRGHIQTNLLFRGKTLVTDVFTLYQKGEPRAVSKNPDLGNILYSIVKYWLISSFFGPKIALNETMQQLWSLKRRQGTMGLSLKTIDRADALSTFWKIL